MRRQARLAIERREEEAKQQLVAQARSRVTDYLLAVSSLDAKGDDVKTIETLAAERALNPAFLEQ